MRALVLLEAVTLKETRHNLDVRASVKPNKSAPFASRNANWQLWAAEIASNSNFWSLTGLLYASYWNTLKQNNLLHHQLNGYHSKKGVTLQKPSTSPSCKKVKIPSDSRACVKSYGSLGPKERCCSRVSVQRGVFWGWPTKRDFLNVAVVVNLRVHFAKLMIVEW